jgi:pantothenate kinase
MIPTYDIEVGVKNIVCRSSFGWNYLRQAAVRMYSMNYGSRPKKRVEYT